ncbi:hypothetical protein HZA87_00910, partial [Candidatus Uhrbacteria bacterium]|nr:hypothetical protein [Candidatus Uhrbacteria bacterium]
SGPAGLTASVEYNPSTSSGSATATTSTLHTDHLGSTSVVTDESGIMIELLDYNPYGNERISWSSSSADGSAQSQKTYIGEYSDDESGLSYLNARYYDPARGQFLSQDTVYLSLGSGTDKREQVALLDPQSQNSYSYGRGNPIGFIDADGHTPSIPASNFTPSLSQSIPSLGLFSGSLYHLIATGMAHDIETVSDSERSATSRILAGISLGLNLMPGGAGEKGAWITTKEAMSGSASGYQKFISGTSSSLSYLLNGVKFDGFRGGVLFDAKSGMQNFVDASTGLFKSWFKDSGGKSLLGQAERQIQAAEGNRIEWHFQFKEVRNAVESLFQEKI